MFQKPITAIINHVKKGETLIFFRELFRSRSVTNNLDYGHFAVPTTCRLLFKPIPTNNTLVYTKST